jgi:hypothetical protein
LANNPRVKRFPVFSFLCLLALAFARPLFASVLEDPSFDHSRYDELLRAYVDADGRVNYEGLRGSSMKDLNDYLAALAKAELRDFSAEERTAFWINAYNAHTLRQILNYPRMNKISEHMEMFDVVLPLARGNYTLNDIEHRILRGKVNEKNQGGPIPGVTLERFDPRLHFVLVCGAVGCPRLANVAYTGKTLEAMLRQASSDFANSPKYVRIKQKRLQISEIMKWYAEDFAILGGAGSYLSRLVDPAKRASDGAELKKLLLTDYDKAQFHYNWDLNDLSGLTQ